MDNVSNHSTVQLGNHFFGDMVVNHNILDILSFYNCHKKIHYNWLVWQYLDYVLKSVLQFQVFYMILNKVTSLAILYIRILGIYQMHFRLVLFSLQENNQLFENFEVEFWPFLRNFLR